MSKVETRLKLAVAALVMVSYFALTSTYRYGEAIVLALEAPIQLLGVVEDEVGQPIEGVRVTVKRNRGWIRSTRYRASLAR